MPDTSSRLRKDPVPSTHGPAWKRLIVCVDVKEEGIVLRDLIESVMQSLKYTLYKYSIRISSNGYSCIRFD